MKKIVIMSAISILALTGCATDDYKRYSETQAAIASARSNAEVARYQALAEIARSGDSTAKVAAVMSLQMGVGQGASQPQQIALPRTAGDVALQWASILLPSLTQVYGINANRQVAITQSNNQAAVAQSTNSTFATMNGNMATSNTSIAGAGFTAVTNVANNGIAQVGTTAAAGLTATINVANTVGTTAAAGLTAVTAVNASSNTAIASVSDAANTSIQAVADVIPQLQPNVTTSTTTSTTTTNNTVTP
jgi:hypothetical protein